MKYTPGPWRVEKEKWDLVIMGSDEDYIAYVPVEEYVLPEESANALLMAAAPAMFAALEEVEWKLTQDCWTKECLWCEEEESNGHAKDCSRQIALAQAKGEERKGLP